MGDTGTERSAVLSEGYITGSFTTDYLLGTGIGIVIAIVIVLLLNEFTDMFD